MIQKYLVPEEDFSTLRYILDFNENAKLSRPAQVSTKKSRKDILSFCEQNGFKFEPILLNYYSNSEKSCILTFYDRYSSKERTDIAIIHTEKFDFETFDKDVLQKFQIKEEEGAQFSLITISHGMPRTSVKTLRKSIEIDKENSYNFNTTVDQIKNDVEFGKSGLILFTGSPGTGKTSLIKWLSQEITDKNFYFMSNNNLNFLSNPAFTEFCLENLDNCVLVLEDCETALADRSKSGGYDISNILNLTDGIMGDMMNLIIIATINTTDTIDPALLRKGRLIRKVDFNKLRKEQVEVLSSKLGKNLNEEMVLTDVYNQESNGVEAKTTKIGFKR